MWSTVKGVQKVRSRSNILIIITHDTGRHLGCYGHGVDTPNLSRLASEGVQFNKAFCTAPQCSPSRASLLTGKYPHSHGLIGLTHRGWRLNPNEPLLPALLANAGYSTHLFGFQHESPDSYALGYQHVVSAKNHSCLNVAPLVIEFLDSKPRTPFFAMVGFSETHRPFPSYDGPIEDVKVPLWLPDEPIVRRDVAGLNTLVERVDEKVGEILNALERNGLADNTLVIYTTDHGIAFPGAKATLFDPGIEIALLMRGPGGFSGGRHVDVMVSNVDIMPTLLEFCDIPIPDGVQGKSLLPLLRGDISQLHEQLFPELTYHAAYDPMRGIRTEHYKYIRSFEQRTWWCPPNVDPSPTKELMRERGYFDRPRPLEMLYDLRNDPLECNNLVDDPAYSDVLSDLRMRLEQWMQETNDPLLKGPVPPPIGAKVTPPDAPEP